MKKVSKEKVKSEENRHYYYSLVASRISKRIISGSPTCAEIMLLPVRSVIRMVTLGELTMADWLSVASTSLCVRRRR